MLNISFLLVNTLIGFCYQFHLVEGIIGGYPARPGQFKYAASIQAYMNHHHEGIPQRRTICSGVIVNDDSVLLAAHCVIGATAKFINFVYSVIVGVVEMQDKDSIEINVIKIIVPLNYDPRQIEDINPSVKVSIYSDLALFKLEKKLGLSHNTKRLIAVKLPPLFSTTLTHLEETAIITGFGLNKQYQQLEKFDDNNPLQYAETLIVPNSWCQLMTNDTIRHDHMCGQLQSRPYLNTSARITKGDGGAPLVINGNHLIGILSHSKMSANKKFKVEIYTKVAFYLPFINAALTGQKRLDNRVAIYEHKKTGNVWKKTVTEI